MTPYAELHCHSYYSLLDGASSPEDLVARAAELGLRGLALTDHDSLAGAVRFWLAARKVDLPAVVGAEVTLEHDTHLTLLAENQTGYANLCRLITAARMDQVQMNGPVDGAEAENGADDEDEQWVGKVEPSLAWERLAHHCQGLIALSGCRQGPVAGPLLRGEPAAAAAAADRLREIFGPDHCFIELQHHSLPDDEWLLVQLHTLAQAHDLACVATNNVHYAQRDASRLRDALIAVRHIETLTEARRAGRLPLNSTYALCSPQEMAHRFPDLPDALQRTVEIAERCQVSLDFSGQRLPRFRTPSGESEFAYLYHLCHENLPLRYPDLRPQVLKQLAHELDIIERAGLAGYFLHVWDIVRFAREEGIRCQGRGSAAGSIVAYLLHITSIDPIEHNLLFERFLSEDKFTTPDIDVDFQLDRREEVIQYVYRTYGADHTAMVCNVNTYKARSAVRDLGKILGFPLPVVDKLAKSLDTHSPRKAADELASQVQEPSLSLKLAGVNLAPTPFGKLQASRKVDPESEEHASHTTSANHPLLLLADLLRRIEGCPRHLSIHSGGMLITGPPLVDVVPLEPATMPGRVIVQWDKDNVEDAGLIKIDLLSLGGLSLVAEAAEHIQAAEGKTLDLDRLPLDDPAIYHMLQRGNTIGTFQVESRAQQQMLPRMKPTSFEDIAVQIAIVRPGPIQGGAVHPYLRRRAGEEPVQYLHESLEPVLRDTMGVVLYQEQAIQIAVAAAGFSPGEADLLRRALSRSRADEVMAAMHARFLRGAEAKGIAPETAEAIFAQLAGFAGYGFCKSHAMSFALIAYQTLYVKRYHPVAFYCGILNHQPMGFYSPEVLLNDAKRHGVTLLPPTINQSEWNYTPERLPADNKISPTKRATGDLPGSSKLPGSFPAGRLALRIGLRSVGGLGAESGQRIVEARTQGAFQNLEDFCRRTCLSRNVVQNLIRAGLLDEFGPRRQLLWRLGDLDYRSQGFELMLPTAMVDLPRLPDLEKTLWEYELLGLSPDVQFLEHYREALHQAGVRATWEVKHTCKAGTRVQVAGMIVVRQRPSTAKGILFLSLEDESGLLDLVVKPNVYKRLRPVIKQEHLVVALGIVQRNARAASVLVHDMVGLH